MRGTTQLPTPANYEALTFNSSLTNPVTLNGVGIVPLLPVLACAGFYPIGSALVPSSASQTTWSRLTNITGLIAGTTRLGDELNLLFRQGQIAASAFASMSSWVWNGSAFVAA
jgi:hypothetical protein